MCSQAVKNVGREATRSQRPPLMYSKAGKRIKTKAKSESEREGIESFTAACANQLGEALVTDGIRKKASFPTLKGKRRRPLGHRDTGRRKGARWGRKKKGQRKA